VFFGLGVSPSKYCGLGLDRLLGGASPEHPTYSGLGAKLPSCFTATAWTCGAVVA
jgi:hypothetical protein